MIRATILGTGGYLPTESRGLSSAYLKVEGTNILMDCGEGTQLACTTAGVKLYEISIICLTHRHADHVLGLPGVLTSIDQIVKVNGAPKKLVVIIAPRSCKYICTNLINAANIHNISVKILYVSGEKQVFNFGKFKIKAFRLEHTVECYGYCVQEVMRPHLNKETADKSGLPEESWKFLQTGHKLCVDETEFGIEAITDGDASRGITVAYATDTDSCPGLHKVLEQADLAIVEGMYYNKDRLPKTFQPKHLTYEDAAYAASSAGVKQMILTHFNPMMKDPANGLRYATDIFSNTVCGVPGMSLEVHH